ncbi:hypothetical protein DXG03_009534 [Asterophora parasitica]|uniref:PCI domain-containing protein n=1 Tax=Asterophora parasitica TaxID=117018 RepID=A0A9P7G658_9AGAR|nr:hypothetical protein DXG03_009534 [Asterophora parasitica]
MSAAMAVDAPRAPKLDLEDFTAKGLSLTPPALHPYFESFQLLHSRRLWHQLTQKLFQFFDEPQSQPYRVDVFERFVSDFENKLNQLRLVEIGVKVSKEIENPQIHLTFLTSLLSRIDTAKSQEAHVLLLATIAHAKLLYGDLEGTKTDMDAAWKVLDTLEGVESGVNAAYYGVAADYYKARAEYAPYYRHSLLYLACVDLEKDLTSEERLVRAHDLGISAFLGDTIYNFGELLMHPILDALVGTPHEWIKKLLFTFNEGNIGKFEALSPLFPKEPILQENYAFLRQKICLMALIESVFKRNADNRTMSFQKIAEETRLPVDEVEHLVMKALSADEHQTPRSRPEEVLIDHLHYDRLALAACCLVCKAWLHSSRYHLLSDVRIDYLTAQRILGAETLSKTAMDRDLLVDHLLIHLWLSSIRPNAL